MTTRNQRDPERPFAGFDKRQRGIALDDEASRAIRGLGLYHEVNANMPLGVTASFVGLDRKPFLGAHAEPTPCTGHLRAHSLRPPALEHALREGLERWPKPGRFDITRDTNHRGFRASHPRGPGKSAKTLQTGSREVGDSGGNTKVD